MSSPTILYSMAPPKDEGRRMKDESVVCNSSLIIHTSSFRDGQTARRSRYTLPRLLQNLPPPDAAGGAGAGERGGGEGRQASDRRRRSGRHRIEGGGATASAGT